MPITLAIQEVEIRRIAVLRPTLAKSMTLSQKYTTQKRAKGLA
jgi:hypothetical protein